MSSQAVDCDALVTTTSVEEITDEVFNLGTLRSLKNDDLPALYLCKPGLATVHTDYLLGDSGSAELGWLGHFVKKSTCLESFGILGEGIFDGCSKQSVDRFFEDLGKTITLKR